MFFTKSFAQCFVVLFTYFFLIQPSLSQENWLQGEHLYGKPDDLNNQNLYGIPDLDSGQRPVLREGINQPLLPFTFKSPGLDRRLSDTDLTRKWSGTGLAEELSTPLVFDQKYLPPGLPNHPGNYAHCSPVTMCEPEVHEDEPMCLFKDGGLCGSVGYPLAPSQGPFPISPLGNVTTKNNLNLSSVVFFIKKTKSGAAHCSGTFVGDNKVLTAAHCLCDGELELGYGSKVSDKDSAYFNITKIDMFHKNYCSGSDIDGLTGYSYVDVAIVSIDIPELDTDSLPSIATNRNFEGGAVTIAGFGRNEKDRNGTLKQTFRYPNTLKCNKWLSAKTGCNTDTDFLGLIGKGEMGGGCQGDSGGPVFNGSGEIIGIIRKGIKRKDSEYNCGAGDSMSRIDRQVSIKNQQGLTISAWLDSMLR